MVWNYCRVKNISGGQLELKRTFSTGEVWVIPDSKRVDWKDDDDVLKAIADGDIQIGTETEWLTTLSDQIDWLKSGSTSVKDLDNRTISHTTPRYLGTYTYFCGRDDNSSDPHGVGGGDNSLILDHTATTKSLSNIARSSNVATIETATSHGLSTGDVVDIVCSSDSSFSASDTTVTVVDSLHFTYSNTGDDSTETSATGTVSGGKIHSQYTDLNTINNTTYIRQGDLMWCNEDIKDIFTTTFSIVPKTTPYTSGSNTNYNLYGGYLIVPASGDGNISVTTPVLVQNTPNEFGQMKAGYWDADWNTTTKQFENIVPNPYGEGEYNMFATEIDLFVFMYERLLMGSGRKDCMTDDCSQIGHNLRMKVLCKTVGDDHDWKMVAALMMYRSKTV